MKYALEHCPRCKDYTYYVFIEDNNTTKFCVKCQYREVNGVESLFDEKGIE